MQAGGVAGGGRGAEEGMLRGKQRGVPPIASRSCRSPVDVRAGFLQRNQHPVAAEGGAGDTGGSIQVGAVEGNDE